MRIFALIPVLATGPALVAAWGVAGHEIVATVAQIHMYDSAMDQVRALLPPSAGGHLAPIAAWADRLRGIEYYRWLGQLHYTDQVDGSGRRPDVVDAIANFTMRLSPPSEDDRAWESLRMLVHFVGDLHQPLHLTGLHRGGTLKKVVFEGKNTTLHRVWDTLAVTRSIRQLPHQPRAGRAVERALRGAIYDDFVRSIMRRELVQGAREHVRCSGVSVGAEAGQQPIQSRRNAGPTVCHQDWANRVDDLTDGYVWPRADGDPSEDLAGDYLDRINGQQLLERLLVRGGLALAQTLNTVFASKVDLAMGVLPVVRLAV